MVRTKIFPMSQNFYTYTFKANMFVAIKDINNQQFLRIEHSVIIAMIHSGKRVHYSCKEAASQHEPRSPLVFGFLSQ